MNRAVWFNASPEGAKAVAALHHFVTQGTGFRMGISFRMKPRARA